MTFLETIKTNLLANATISGIIGTGLYPVILPQGKTPPCILYRKMAGGTDYSQGGICEKTATYQFQAIAEHYHQVLALQEAIREVLELETFTCTEGEMDQCHHAGFEEEGYFDDIKVYYITENYSFSIT